MTAASPSPETGWSDAVHGGPDAQGVPLHDFSTNSNAAGPCEEALHAVQSADPRHYPDPGYAALRGALGAFHGVAPGRVALAASASEFIHRLTALAAQQGARHVAVPLHGFGEYARAAQARGLAVERLRADSPAPLQWACEPSSPLGQGEPVVSTWAAAAPAAAPAWRVVDCAYVPLRLDAAAPWPAAPVAHGADCWQLWTPNKALGMTGVRAAYAIAPADGDAQVQALDALAPAWPVGAHGVALLQAWVRPSVQRWRVYSLDTLRSWKARQEALCIDLGWSVHAGSLANYFCAQPDTAGDLSALQLALAALRRSGIKLRDCASFGLAGSVRLGVLPPAAQDALRAAWNALPRERRTMPVPSA